MKASSNGVLQCTVPDGWAAEVEWSGMGWALPPEGLSDALYDTLETEIAPLFWQRDETGIPTIWVDRMQKTMAMADKFSARRMLQQYQADLYSL